MAYKCHRCSELSIELLVGLTKIEFLPRHFPERAFFRHHACFDDLEASAERGCEFCRLIIECFRGMPGESSGDFYSEPKIWKGQDMDVDASMYAVAKKSPPAEVRLAISVRNIFDREAVTVLDTIMVQLGPGVPWGNEDDPRPIWKRAQHLRLALVTPRDNVCYVDQYRIGRFPVEPDLGSEPLFNVARQWLRECQNNHVGCASKENAELPTRVIDVGTSDGSRPPRIMSRPGARGTYAALSHCWGGKIPTLLTTQTEQEFRLALPLPLLPANFRDAIKIAQQLHIPYLWIDSLCILQDSQQDWEQESGKMSSIYCNATITISAMAAERSTDGILKSNPSTAPDPRPASLRIYNNSSQGAEVIAMRAEKSEEEETFRYLNYNSPLNRRGWTLQESVLSPRYLYYGRDKIYWKCAHALESSDGVPREDLPRAFMYSTIASVFQAGPLVPQQATVRNRADVLSAYYDLVRDYSQRNLTLETDKLPAVSALAQGLHPIVGGEYLAGLWSSDLCPGLLWFVEQPKGRRAEKYRAPSWSWASVNSAFVYTHCLCDEHATALGPSRIEVIGYAITPCSSSNPYGQVASARLEIRGLTAPLVLSSQVLNPRQARSQQIGVGAVWLDEGCTSGRKPFLCLAPVDHDSGFCLAITCHEDKLMPTVTWEVDHSAYHSSTYMVLLVSGTLNSCDEPGCSHCSEDYEYELAPPGAYCLVVRPAAAPNAAGEWERAGYLELDLGKAWDKLLSWTRRTLVLV